MRFKLFSASRFQRAASPWIGLLIIGLWSLGCGGSASRGSASGWDAQPAADSEARAAMVVVRDYIDALNEGDLARAYGYWSHDDMTFDEFQRQRANIDRIGGEVGNPRYVSQQRLKVPVEVGIGYTDGSAECAKGTYELWREGAASARWTIISSDIKEMEC